MPAEIHFTLGPACRAPEVLGDLLRADVDACRFNLSHFATAELTAAFELVRAAARELGLTLKLGADLRGRKLRLGPLAGGALRLKAGDHFCLHPVAFDSEALVEGAAATVGYPELGRIATAGDLVLLDDAAMRLRVDKAEAEQVRCVVDVGGTLTERSGFNLPGRAIALPALSQKDHADLDALAALEPDFVYLSYVESPSDIDELRVALTRRGLTVPIVAKIERAAALEAIDGIAGVADVLCLARGDLGVEVPQASLLEAERAVAAAARSAGKPLLLAGEVLASMVSGSRPLRAEAIDVALAQELGVSGYVLSDETAVGHDPAAAIRALRELTGAAAAATAVAAMTD